MKILLIEDEVKTAQYLKKGLEENGYEVEHVDNGKAGLVRALTSSYTVIISDIILPDLEGREICKRLRAESVETPFLMLTALGSTEDIVTGFEVGADDYLVKPFEFQVLLARIKALAKRFTKDKAEQSVLRIGNLQLNPEQKQVVRDGKIIELTAKEFALLEYFMRNQGKVISRAELARNIWKVDFDTGTNMVEVYVSYLRNKIDKGFHSKLIHTQFGMGYICKEE